MMYLNMRQCCDQTRQIGSFNATKFKIKFQLMSCHLLTRPSVTVINWACESPFALIEAAESQAPDGNFQVKTSQYGDRI